MIFALVAIESQAAQPGVETGRSDASIKAPLPETTGLGFRGFQFAGKSYLGGSSTVLPSEGGLTLNQWLQLSVQEGAAPQVVFAELGVSI